MPVYSQVAYCACGQQLWLEYLHGAQGWFTRVFDDDGRQVERCPACGGALDPDALD